MLFFFYGNDYAKKDREVRKLVGVLKQKKEMANYFHYDFFDINVEELRRLLSSQGLFEVKNIIHLTNILQDKEIKKWFLENLENIEKDASAWVLNIDEGLTPKEKEKISKIAFQFHLFEVKEKKDDKIFQFLDLIQKRDKKEAWRFWYQNFSKIDEAKKNEILTMIFWAFKNLWIVKKFPLKETNLNPFVYKKTSWNKEKWGQEELEKILETIVFELNEFRKESLDLNLLIEKIILKI